MRHIYKQNSEEIHMEFSKKKGKKLKKEKAESCVEATGGLAISPLFPGVAARRGVVCSPS